MNSQTVKRIGQIIYTQLLCFFASQEMNSKYYKHFPQKDIHLSITEERKIRGNLEVQQQQNSKINNAHWKGSYTVIPEWSLWKLGNKMENAYVLWK